MNIDIKETKKNPLLNREEVVAIINFEGKTPSRLVLLQEFAGKLNSNSELVVIKDIKTTFGQEKARVLVYKYASKESLDKIEHEHLMKKHKPKVKKEGA